MKREDLKTLGLEDAAIDSIMALHGKDIEGFKAQVSTSKTQIDTLTAQVSEANAAIEGFKKLDVEGIKAAADDWKSKAEQATKDAAAQMASLKFDYALEGALSGAKARNAKAVMPLLSRDALTDANGEFIAERFNEQLAKIKSENDYLFEDAQPAPKIVTGGNNKSVVGDPVIDAARKAAGLSPKI